MELLIPVRFRGVHSAHQDRYSANPRNRPIGAGLDLFGRRNDGSEFPAEISLSAMETENGQVTIAAVREIGKRLEAEQAHAYLAAIVDSSDDAIIGKRPTARSSAGTTAPSASTGIAPRR